MTIPDGTILENRYRIDSLLAKGGMGIIYRGYDTKLQTMVAVKGNHFRTPDGIEQFEQEGLILARLRHPSLPRVIDHFSYQETQYIVMDFVEGQDLWEIIQAEGHPLDEQRAVTYMVQVCDAVSYLHNFDPPIIHRDIKPQNIKITPTGQAVLVDFGIAKLASDEEHSTQSGARGITPGFSPPEQYTDNGTKPASDIYALGATLYAVLTGTKPPDSVRLITGKAKLESLNAPNGGGISPQLSHLIDHAMQPRPENRPPNVQVWQQELQTTMNALSLLDDQAHPSTMATTATTTTTMLPQTSAPVTANPPTEAAPEQLDDTHPSGGISTQPLSWIWGGLAVAILIMGVGLVGFWLGRTDPTELVGSEAILKAIGATETAQAEAGMVEGQADVEATLAALAQLVTQQAVTPTEPQAALIDPPTHTPTSSPTSTSTTTTTPIPTDTPTAIPTNTPTIAPTAAAISVMSTPVTVLTTTLLSITESITQIVLPTPEVARIAFQSDRDGYWAVYSLDARNGSQPVRLTSLPHIGENPVGSADGQWLAFSDSREDQPGIFRLNLSNREISVLVSQFDATHPAWSPNGEQLVFDAGNQIDVLNIEAGSGFNVAKTKGASHPVWSPDGQTILFDTEHATNNYELFTIKVDGRDLAQLTVSDGINETQPAWSPDGQRIVFVHDDTFTREIHVMNVDGSNRLPLAVGPKSNLWSHQHPVWSPDGQQIAFASSREGNYEIYVMDADGSNLIQLTHHPGNDLHPTWLP